jgi:phosphate transport system ATP-binding protein
MNDTVPGSRVEGSVLFEGRDIYSDYDVLELRSRSGWFPKAQPVSDERVR